MIRPGSLDIMPDCLDYDAKPLPTAPETWAMIVLAALIGSAVGLAVIWAAWQMFTTFSCPMWILQGTSGALVWSC